MSDITATAEVWTGFWRQGHGRPWKVMVRDCPDAPTAWARLLADERLPRGGDLMVSRGSDPGFPTPQERSEPR